MQREKSSNYTIQTFCGYLQPQGRECTSINLELTSAWQKGRIEVLVSTDDDMLWGIKHLKEFKRIPQGFPNIILNEGDEFCFRTTIKLLSQEFTTEFDDILSDELNPLRMKGDPMRISLKLKCNTKESHRGKTSSAQI